MCCVVYNKKYNFFYYNVKIQLLFYNFDQYH